MPATSNASSRRSPSMPRVLALATSSWLVACMVAAPPPSSPAPAPAQPAPAEDAGASIGVTISSDGGPGAGGEQVGASIESTEATVDESPAQVQAACAAAGGTIEGEVDADVVVCVGPGGARAYVRGDGSEASVAIDTLLPAGGP